MNCKDFHWIQVKEETNTCFTLNFYMLCWVWTLINSQSAFHSLSANVSVSVRVNVSSDMSSRPPLAFINEEQRMDFWKPNLSSETLSVCQRWSKYRRVQFNSHQHRHNYSSGPSSCVVHHHRAGIILHLSWSSCWFSCFLSEMQASWSFLSTVAAWVTTPSDTHFNWREMSVTKHLLLNQKLPSLWADSEL